VGLLTGKTVALVANGRSGTDQCVEIDACDFVVRLSAWVSEGPKNAGSKVSAVSGVFSKEANNPYVTPGAPGVEIPDWLWAKDDWELWCPLAGEYFLEKPTYLNVGDWKWLLTFSNGHAMRLIRQTAANMIYDYVRYINPTVTYPSLGLNTFAMVMDLEPTMLHIWGYDATVFGKPDYNKAQVPMAEAIAHDFVAEKRIIAELADKGTWCGVPNKTKLVWHFRPELPGA